jgi:outer membrane biosynthesis protein TonB
MVNRCYGIVKCFPISSRNGNDSAYCRNRPALDASLRGMRNRYEQPGRKAIGVRSGENLDLAKRVGLYLAGTAVAVAAVGCASPAPPKPPTLNLPALATDIQAQRQGGRVLVHWTTSDKTSDDLPVNGPITAEVCREVGPRPTAPAARLKACTPVVRLLIAPGRSQATDDLPASLQADPVTLLTYRVQLFNAAGRSAGESAVAGFAAAGTAPPVIEDLHATNLEAGAVLEWEPSSEPSVVELERTDLTPHAPKPHPTAAAAPAPQPAPAKKKKKKKTKAKAAPASHPKKTTPEQTTEVHLRVSEPTVSNAPHPANHNEGTVDITAQMGEAYRYVANRVRPVTLGVHKLEIESAPSQPVTFVHLDIFPPQPPTGLEAIAGSDPRNPAAIDLSWEPNAEVDLAGYLVYRQPVDASGKAIGPALQLTSTPVVTPAFRDLTAVAGQSYAYQVLAVDQAGNRSTLSDASLQTSAR